MDLQSLTLSKSYADSLALGFSEVSDIGNGKVRFELTDGSDHVDVTVPTVKGDAGKITIGTVVSGDYSSVTNVGTASDAVLNFVLEKGEQGEQGNAGEIEIGHVGIGTVAQVSNVGTASHAILNFTIPKGDKGDKGDRGERGLSTLNLTVVEELPASGDSTTIYLMAKETSEEQNVYDEYVYVNGTWEKIGDTKIDLSNYVSTNTANTKLMNISQADYDALEVKDDNTFYFIIEE